MLDSADAYNNHFSLDPVCEEVAYLAWFLDGSDHDGRGTYVNVDLMTFACRWRGRSSESSSAGSSRHRQAKPGNAG